MKVSFEIDLSLASPKAKAAAQVLLESMCGQYDDLDKQPVNTVATRPAAPAPAPQRAPAAAPAPAKAPAGPGRGKGKAAAAPAPAAVSMDDIGADVGGGEQWDDTPVDDFGDPNAVDNTPDPNGYISSELRLKLRDALVAYSNKNGKDNASKVLVQYARTSELVQNKDYAALMRKLGAPV